VKDGLRSAGPGGHRDGDRAARKELLEAIEHLKNAVTLLLEGKAAGGSAEAPARPRSSEGTGRKATATNDLRVRELARELGRMARRLGQTAGAPDPDPSDLDAADLSERRSRNADCMD